MRLSWLVTVNTAFYSSGERNPIHRITCWYWNLAYFACYPTLHA